MRTIRRPRRYVAARRLTLCRPLLAFDPARDAYVLRAVGHRFGPVLREDRRLDRDAAGYAGPERRAAARAVGELAGHTL